MMNGPRQIRGGSAGGRYERMIEMSKNNCIICGSEDIVYYFCDKCWEKIQENGYFKDNTHDPMYARVKTEEKRRQTREEQNPHDQIAEAAHHHPDCQCNICYYGADVWLHHFHPGEY